MEKPDYHYNQESHSQRLSRKSQEMPIFPMAIGVCLGAVGYGIYAYRKKGNMSTSVYLMQLRVGAQGAAVGVLTVGLIYAMANQYLSNKKD